MLVMLGFGVSHEHHSPRMWLTLLMLMTFRFRVCASSRLIQLTAAYADTGSDAADAHSDCVLGECTFATCGAGARDDQLMLGCDMRTISFMSGLTQMMRLVCLEALREYSVVTCHSCSS